MTPTCEDFATTWPVAYPRADIATNRKRASAIKRFADSFAGRRLDSITRAEARAWALRNPHHLRYARELYADALDDEIVERNPFAGLRLSFKRAELEYPCMEEVETLIEAAAAEVDEHFAAMVRFAAFTGLRLGEQLYLRPFQILENTGRVAVEKQLTEDGREKLPKGEKTRRALLPEPTYPLSLGDRAMAPIWPYSRYAHHRRWDKTRIAAGMPDLRWHSLRHFNATWLLDLGASYMDVALHLGNSALEVEKTYGHPDPELALDRLAGLVR